MTTGTAARDLRRTALERATNSVPGSAIRPAAPGVVVMGPATSPRVVFVAGVGRSGTTIIERTLAEADGVTGLGELIHLWEHGVLRDETCACGEPFSSCVFWTKVGDVAFGGWERFQALRMVALKNRVGRIARVPAIHAGVPEEFVREAMEYAATFARVYAAAAEVTGDVLVDSSRQAPLAWILHRAGAVDLSLLHVVRDPRAVAVSWLRDARAVTPIDASTPRAPRRGPGRLALRWGVHNLAVESLGRRLPASRMRYEDFAADPVGRTAGVLAAAGVADDVRRWVSPQTVRLGTSHSVAGSPMRLLTGEVDVRPADWRAELPPRARRTVTVLTAPLLHRYGYAR